MHKPQNGFPYVSDGQVVGEILRNTVTHLVIFLGAKLDKRRVYLLIDGTAHDEGSNGSKSIQDSKQESRKKKP